jgi:hypothetical protein
MEQPAIHYLYADCGGRLVEIHGFDRTAGVVPLCPACRGELVAVQGEQRGWHFRHRTGGSCAEADYALACAALERRNVRSRASRQRRRLRTLAAAAGPAAAAVASEAWLGHPLVVGVGLLAALGMLFLLGEARRR